MGVPKILFLGGLLGGIFLLLMGWVAFTVFHLADAVTGGLLTNVSALTSLLGAAMPALGVIVPMILGGLILVIFPLDWALTYRPDDIGLMFALIIPWAVAGVLVALIFAHNAKQGFLCGIALMVYPIILGIIAIAGLNALSNSIGGGLDIGALVNGVIEGLVDRSLIVAIITATLEGGALAGVFGALIGSVKYDPGNIGTGKKVKSKSKDTRAPGAPSTEGKKEEDLFVNFE